ncbi:mannose-1-phosphate guanylyltransferase [Reichenbachiella carrageenanivorans]|uniref:Mannose-1-phosphate guanylyltransferase n=1 Tax=Reichenbachiella carrageenanivorans TaxID=2979869 RepID=A0ABY6D678_9BACT|nr:mannose-1-phosphate guanylyltransferase [Reichenbachiella carrageenanivorans]UXX80578.1 mannose-1-phosphate guanylyltransferase [Reichenbachiella carrageenanivorans]
MKSEVFVVIMAGGVGSRFWPYSRNSRPKQFIDVLGNGKSLLQMTYQRFLPTANKDNILVVTNDIYANLVKEQLPDISEDHILTEPARRNTAPCIAYAAYKIRQKNPNAVIVVTPADHAIFQEEKFTRVIKTATTAAEGSDKLLTVGILPNRPETGYGYIQYIESEDEVKKVKTFTEKPELDLAKKFLESGDFVWNAGIFVWSVPAIIKSFENALPDMAEAFEEGADKYYQADEKAYVDRIYPQCENISIDYGILEKSKSVYVVQGNFDWSDLGSWNSLHEIREKDTNDNVTDGDVILGECSNNIVKSETKRLIVLDQLEGYLVGDFEDVLIICKKDQDAKFREYVAEVKKQHGDKYL